MLRKCTTSLSSNIFKIGLYPITFMINVEYIKVIYLNHVIQKYFLIN